MPAIKTTRVFLASLLALVTLCSTMPSYAEQPAQASEQVDQKTESKPKAKRRRGRAVKSEPQGLIRVSKETTFFTEPLFENGRVDYLAALNNYKKPEGLTLHNNGAVYFIKAIGVQENPPSAHTINQWKALGLSKDGKGLAAFPTKKDPAMIDSGKYTKLKTKSLTGTEKNKRQDELLDTLTNTEIGPWKKSDLPDTWQWIQMNEKSLDLLVQATKQPLFYLPYAWNNKEESPEILIEILLPGVQNSRVFARLLAMRALNHLGENRPQEAANDLLALHKFARQIGYGGTLIEVLVAIALDSIAFKGDQQLVQHPGFSVSDLKQYAKTIQSLPPVTNMKDSLNIYERCVGLDSVQRLAQPTGKDMKLGVMALGLPASFQKTLQALTFDWNYALVIFNEYYDQLDEINQKPYLVQQKLFEQKLQELKETQKKLTGFSLITQGVLLGRKARTEMFTDILKSLLIPAFKQVFITEQRGLLKKELALTHISLELYKRDNGIYPEKLNMLVNEYIAKVPQDRFVEKQNLKYTSNGKSFTLYSVGPDGIDNEGSDNPNAKREYDVVVKVP